MTIVLDNLCHFSASLSLSIPGASVAPVDVEVSVLNSTALFVEWGRIEICRTANGLIAGYRIQYRTEPDGVVRSVDRPGNRSSGGNISISGLAPFTVYSVQVAAVNVMGHVGAFSNPKTVQTDEDGEQQLELRKTPHSILLVRLSQNQILLFATFQRLEYYTFVTL